MSANLEFRPTTPILSIVRRRERPLGIAAISVLNSIAVVVSALVFLGVSLNEVSARHSAPLLIERITWITLESLVSAFVFGIIATGLWEGEATAVEILVGASVAATIALIVALLSGVFSSLLLIGILAQMLLVFAMLAYLMRRKIRKYFGVRHWSAQRILIFAVCLSGAYIGLQYFSPF